MSRPLSSAGRRDNEPLELSELGPLRHHDLAPASVAAIRRRAHVVLGQRARRITPPTSSVHWIGAIGSLLGWRSQPAADTKS